MTRQAPPLPPGQKSLEERLAERELQRRRARPVYNPARPLSKAIYKTLLPALKDKDSGATISSLTARWEEIVGPRLSKLSRPVRIVKAAKGYVLLIEAPSAAAPMIQHQSGIIIERVNLAGAARIKAIRLQQTKTAPPQKPGAGSADNAAQATASANRLTPEQIAEIDASLEGIESPALRKALHDLGVAMMNRRAPR